MTSTSSFLAVVLLLASACVASPTDGDVQARHDHDRRITLAFNPSTGDIDSHKSNHLKVLSRVLAAHGAFEILSGSRDVDGAAAPVVGGTRSAAAATATATAADVVWEFEPEAIPTRLRPGQRANHFPGMGALTSKAGLAELVATAMKKTSAREEGGGDGDGFKHGPRAACDSSSSSSSSSARA